MGFSNLATKIEQAAKALHTDNITGRNPYAGLDSETETLPATLLHAEVGEESPLHSGNYKCKLTISTMDSADRSTLTQHREGSAAVFDLFLDDNIAQLLSDEVDDFSILMVNGRAGTETRVEDRQWVSGLSLDIYACATDIVA